MKIEFTKNEVNEIEQIGKPYGITINEKFFIKQETKDSIEVELKERFINKIVNTSASYISLFAAAYKGIISAYMIAGKDIEKLVKDEVKEISK